MAIYIPTVRSQVGTPRRAGRDNSNGSQQHAATVPIIGTSREVGSHYEVLVVISPLLSLSLYYMYTRDNGVPIGLFLQFRVDLQTCFDVLAVRSEVQTQG